MRSAEKVRDTTLDDENNRTIIECCNNTHQGAPYIGKHMCACASDFGDGSHVTWSKMFLVAVVILSVCLSRR